MNAVATTAGSPWGISAISNAEWEGARLVDVLRAAGAGSHTLNCIPPFNFNPTNMKSFLVSLLGDEETLSEVGVRHVQFTAAEGMQASIPLHKALNTCKYVRLTSPRLRNIISTHTHTTCDVILQITF